MSAEERASERIDIDTLIFVEAGKRSNPKETGDIVVCNSLDLSETGLQIMLDQSIDKGRIVRICLDVQGLELVFVIAQVRWLREEGGFVRHGLMLLENSDSDLAGWRKAVESLSRKIA